MKLLDYLAKLGTPECKSLIETIKGEAKADGKFKSAKTSQKVKRESLLSAPDGHKPSFLRKG